MDSDKLTPEQLQKVENLSPEEILKLAEEEGIELTDEQMDAVSGGATWFKKHDTEIACPKCHRTILFDGDHGVPNNCPYCGDNWQKYSWK